MRNLLLAKNVAYATGSDLNAVPEGAIGVFYNKDGALTLTNTGSDVVNEAMLVLGRSAANGGPIVLPIYKNNFTFVKGVHQAASTFKATYKVVAPTMSGEYSIIVAKKGVRFNERNKWTASHHVVDTSMTAADLASKLAESINNNSVSSGVSATVEGDTLTITAAVAGVDYQIKGADNLFGIDAEVTTAGVVGYGDAAYVKDLAEKAAADAGFEYTYRDVVVDLYPNHPLDPLAQPNAADAGFTIFTLRFAEPRKVKTVDEVVNQIVQVVFPTGAAAIATFETVCTALSK